MGCGACTTVCPSGALSFAYPTVPDLGTRMRTLLATLREGRRPRRLRCCCTPPDARRVLASARAARRGLPARVIPLEVHHIAAVGIDVWLAALA